MYSKTHLILAAAVLLASCSVKEDRYKCIVPVSVRVSGFTISQEDYPSKATESPSDYTGVKAMTLAFYDSEGSRRYCTTQLKADESTYSTFGNFDLELPMGRYTMIVLGYGSEYPIVFNSMTSASFGEEKSRETFAYSESITIDSPNPAPVQATLSRIVTRLSVQSTDLRPDYVRFVRISLSKGGKEFNPLNGFASSDNGLSSTITPSTAAGEATKSLINFFIVSEEEPMDVLIETLDADERVLSSKTVQNVPFKRNRTTVLQGSLYTASGAAGFSLETGYEEICNLTF